jgi:hypothetical protein
MREASNWGMLNVYHMDDSKELPVLFLKWLLFPSQIIELVILFTFPLLLNSITSSRRRRRWVDNIKIDLREIEWDGMDWINLTQDRDQ